MNKKIFILGLVPFVVGCTAITSNLNNHFKSNVQNMYGQENSSWSEVSYKDRYSYGEFLEIQERTFSKDGQAIACSSLVSFPSGKQTKETTIQLKEVGQYIISYTANINGKIFCKQEKFNVRYGVYYFGNERSSMSYGDVTYNMTDPRDPSKNTYKTENGLVVNIAKDDVLHFTKHIDVSNLTKTKNIIKGYIAPTNFGATDFSTLTFKLTDAKDKNVYVTYSIYAYEISSQGGWSFSGAAPYGQETAGYLVSQSTIKKGKGTGMSTATCFSGIRRNSLSNPIMYQNADLYKWGFSFSMDTNENEVYGLSSNPTVERVCDLDDSNYFDRLFEGFPSGKADLEISCDGFSGSSGRFVITELMGYDSLENMEFEDTTGPEITIDSPYQIFPVGKVGLSYTIPEATAYDDYSGPCKVNTEVIYNYVSENPSHVTVINGTFKPTKSGSYFVRYSSEDEAGNVSILTKAISVYPELDDIDFDLENVPTKGEVGDSITLPSPSDITGGSGLKTFTIFASKGNYKELIKDNVFIPNDIGTWTITYVVQDFLGQTKEETREINVGMNENYKIIGKAPFLTHYISNCEYTMPEVYLYHKVNDTSVEIIPASFKLNNKVYNAKEKFKVEVTNNGDPILFEILGEQQTLTTVSSKGIVPFVKEYNPDLEVDVSKLKIINYFESTDNKEISEEGLKITTSENGSLKFVKPLNKNNVSASLYNIYSLSSKAEIDVKIVDIYDESKSITVKAITEGPNVMYRYGDKSSKAEFNFSQKAYNSLEYSFDGTSVSLGGLNVPVSKYDNGATFNGFENDVYLSIEYKGFNSGEEFMVRTIVNNPITDRTSDKTAPVVSLIDPYTIPQEYLDTITLPRAIAFDVLSPNVDFFVTVEDENRNIVSSVDGVLLQNAPYRDGIQIKLETYGQYYIKYTASESSDFIKKPNTGSTEFYITVFDKIAPTIEITSSYQTQVKVGQSFVVPNYKAEDNVTPADDLIKIVTVKDPNGKTYYLDCTTENNRDTDLNGNKIPAINTFVTKQVGTHIVTIMVADQSGNSSTFTYKVEVAA